MGNVDDNIWKQLLSEVDDNGDGQVINYFCLAIISSNRVILLYFLIAILQGIQGYDVKANSWRVREKKILKRE